MNTDTATHANTLLAWALGLPVNGKPLRDPDVRAAATALARAVNATLSASVTPADVAKQWDERAPRVIAGPANLLRLDPGALRGYFDECPDCDDGVEHHHCDRIRSSGVTDEQLARAADKVMTFGDSLDEGTTLIYEQILAVALVYAAREARPTA